jgi:hypothetical protein
MGENSPNLVTLILGETFCTIFLHPELEFKITCFRLGGKMALLSWLYSRGQGCQIFLDTKYQNGEKYTKLPRNCEMVPK